MRRVNIHDYPLISQKNQNRELETAIQSLNLSKAQLEEQSQKMQKLQQQEMARSRYIVQLEGSMAAWYASFSMTAPFSNAFSSTPQSAVQPPVHPATTGYCPTLAPFPGQSGPTNTTGASTTPPTSQVERNNSTSENQLSDSQAFNDLLEIIGREMDTNREADPKGS